MHLKLAQFGEEESPEIPVCCNFNVQGHLNIQQVLILPKVTRHLVLCTSKLIFKMPNRFLLRTISRLKSNF